MMNASNNKDISLKRHSENSIMDPSNDAEEESSKENSKSCNINSSSDKDYENCIMNTSNKKDEISALQVGNCSTSSSNDMESKIPIYSSDDKKYESFYNKYNVIAFIIGNVVHYKCKVCSKTIKHKYDVSRHHRLHTRKYKCAICTVSFAKQWQLKKHTVTHKNAVKRKSMKSCRICRKRFWSISGLYKHCMLHKCDFITCVDCGQVFKTMSEFQEHKRFHEEHMGSAIICKYCGKSFLNLSELEIHKPVHGTEQPYICEICGKRFAYRNVFKAHCISHTEESPYFCHICFVSFKHKTMLDRHLTCALCDDKLEEIEDSFLNRFMHTEKLHVCEICLVRFRNRKEFYRAVFSNICSICKEGFDKRVLLEQHRLSHDEQMMHNSPSYKKETHDFLSNSIQEPNCILPDVETGRNTCYISDVKTEHVAYYSTRITQKYICHICNVKYGTKFQLKAHLKCELCDKALTNINNPTLRALVLSKKLHVCESCVMRYQREKEKHVLDMQRAYLYRPVYF